MSSLPAPNTWLLMLKKRTIQSVCFESDNVLRQKCKVLFIPIIFCSFCNNPTQVNTCTARLCEFCSDIIPRDTHLLRSNTRKFIKDFTKYFGLNSINLIDTFFISEIKNKT